MFLRMGNDVPAWYCCQAMTIQSNFSLSSCFVLQCFRKWVTYPTHAMISSGMKPAPPSSAGPWRMALDVFQFYPHFVYSLGNIFFSMMVRFVVGMKDCGSVYSVAGLNTDSYNILVSVLVAFVLIMASEIKFSFCVIASVCAL